MILIKKSINKKLIILIISFTAVFTLCTVFFQLYINYNKEVKILKQRISSLEKTHFDIISSSLWSYDNKLMQKAVDGIFEVGEVQFVLIKDTQGNIIHEKGQRNPSDSVIEETVPLTYSFDENSNIVGSIYIQVSLDSASEHLMTQFWIYLIGELLKSSVLALVLLVMMRKNLTSHLEKVAKYITTVDPNTRNDELKLNKKIDGDEIDIVVENLNKVICLLSESIDKQKEMNATLEENVIQRTKSLDAALIKNENLIRVICHDISNHINVVQSSIYLLNKGKNKNDPEKFSKYIDRANKHNKVIVEILEHVKKLKSLESGKSELTLSKVHLHGLLYEVKDTFEEKIVLKNQSIVIEGVDESTAVLADKVSLKTNILNNLISNAIKFSPENGLINISVIKISDKIEIKIKDSGIGIPNDLIDKIFDPSEKTSRKGTGNESGTGFGLPIVYMFMKYNKGEIKVESETEGENQGTTFTLILNQA